MWSCSGGSMHAQPPKGSLGRMGGVRGVVAEHCDRGNLPGRRRRRCPGPIVHVLGTAVSRIGTWQPRGPGGGWDGHSPRVRWYVATSVRGSTTAGLRADNARLYGFAVLARRVGALRCWTACPAEHPAFLAKRRGRLRRNFGAGHSAAGAKALPSRGREPTGAAARVPFTRPLAGANGRAPALATGWAACFFAFHVVAAAFVGLLEACVIHAVGQAIMFAGASPDASRTPWATALW